MQCTVTPYVLLATGLPMNVKVRIVAEVDALQIAAVGMFVSKRLTVQPGPVVQVPSWNVTLMNGLVPGVVPAVILTVKLVSVPEIPATLAPVPKAPEIVVTSPLTNAEPVESYRLGKTLLGQVQLLLLFTLMPTKSVPAKFSQAYTELFGTMQPKRACEALGESRPPWLYGQIVTAPASVPYVGTVPLP